MPQNQVNLADILSDSAVYRRTRAGQRELLRVADRPATTATRVLARVNGYTDLRCLVDLSPREAAAIGAAVVQLVDEGLIEMAD